jgi:hypothetical protein
MYNKKRRSQSGINNGNSKLTWEDVDCIRSVYSNGDATAKQLAKEFNVGLTTIWHVLLQDTWHPDSHLERQSEELTDIGDKNERR